MIERGVASGVIALLGLFLVTGSATANTAAFSADGYAVSLQPAGTSLGETVFFTSYDGTTEVPIFDDLGTSLLFSSEVRPLVLGSNILYTDYLISFSTDAFNDTYEFGSVAFLLNASDADGDGLLDVLELSKPGTFSFSGTTQPDANAFDIFYNTPFNGTVVRQAGSRRGTYSGSYVNPSAAASFSGVFSLSGAAGTVTYTPGSPILTWNLSLTEITGEIYQLTGTSTYTANGTDQILIPSFTLAISPIGLSTTTLPAVLNRSGNTFRGTVEVVDGGPFTSWPDYTTYRANLTDSNDANNDGIPDITSAPEPSAGFLQLTALVVVAALRRRRGMNVV
jgi:hypothetical protein